MSRKQVDAWLAPVRRAFADMKTGEVDSIDGCPVTRLRPEDGWAKTEYCIAGFLGLIGRVLPSTDLSAMTLIQQQLADDTPMTIEDIDAALRLLRDITKPLMRLPWSEVISAVRVEQIQIEIDAIREAA